MFLDYITFDDFTFRIARDSNNPNLFFFSGIDLATYLGYKHPKAVIYKNVSPYNKFKFYVLTRYNRRKSAYFLHPNGVKELIYRSKLSPHKISRFCNFFNFDFFILPYNTVFCIDILISSFSDLSPIREYHLPPYLIDLYFPSINLVVEFDEFNHSGYDKSYESKRHEYISSKLNCHFLRVNPYSPTFNLGDIIFYIRNLASSSKI